MSSLHLGLIGAGGLGGEIGEGLVRKGVGRLWISDFDRVERTNLNRQLFDASDIGKPKALCLARRLSKMGFGGTVITGVPMSFQEAVEAGLVEQMDGLICGVDNNQTRVDACQHALQNNLPIFYTAVSRDGNNGTVLIQLPGKACYGCFYKNVPQMMKDGGRLLCPADPAVKDILKVMGGIVLFAVDSVFMERKRNWNFREFFFCGFVGERVANVARKADCPLCGSEKSAPGGVTP